MARRLGISNIGQASPDLSTFTGAHTGFGTGGLQGMGFGRLLQQRQKLQQAMMKEQLKAMKLRAKTDRQDRLDAEHQRKLDQKAQEQRRQTELKATKGHYAYGERPGLGLPQAIAGEAPLYWQNALSKQANMPFAPQSGGFAGPGAGASLGEVTEAAAGPSTYARNVAQTRSPFTNQAMYNQWGQATGGVPEMRGGGYVPKTGPVKLHKGEVVLSPEQTQQMFPGIGPGSPRKGYEHGSLSPLDFLGPLSPSQPGGKAIRDIGQSGMDLFRSMYGVKADEVTDEDINYFLKEAGQAPVSGLGQGLDLPSEGAGGLAGAPTTPGLPGGAIESVGAAGERSFTLRGEKPGPSERFEESLTKKRQEAERLADRAKMAGISAQNMQTYMMKRPNVDNKALEKIVKSREKEQKTLTKKSETLGQEVTASRIQQADIQGKMAQQFFTDRTKRLDTAFDSINALWKQAVANPNDDLGEEQYAQYGMSMLAPYIDDLAEMSGASREETQQGLYRTLIDAYEDPSAMMWIKMRLQGR